MKTDRTCHSSRTGGVLVLVMLILIAFSLMTAALLQLGWNSSREAEYQFNKAQAFSLAEAGLEQFKAIVNSNRFPITYATGARDWSTAFPSVGSNRVVVSDDTRNGWDNNVRLIKKYIITSTGWARNGAVQTNTLSAIIKTFGDYLFSTHSEGSVFFTTGDLLHGEVYTDGTLNINGTPIFYDLVQSSASSVNGSSAASIFTGGLLLNAPQLDWVSVQQQVTDLASAPGAETFTGNYDITFADTKATLSNRTSHAVTTNTITSGKIFYVTGDAYVKGTVGTRVSVATPGAIYITGDLIYKSAAANPNPSSWASGWVPAVTEALGLYSKTQVQIASGIGAVNIHAAILVPVGNLGFNAADKNSSIGSPYINLYGSIGQYIRGVVGTIGGSGYLKNYNYDSRFRETPPPGIPYSIFFFSEWKQL